MSQDSLCVADNLVISLDYTLRLQDGQVVDSSSGGDPLQFLQGAGHIIPGLEKALYGMSIGDKKDVVVSPADGYGDMDPNAFQVVPRQAFPANMTLQEGQMLHMRNSNTQQVFQVVVQEIRSDQVLLNFNHPLAGQTLYFAVEVVGLRSPTAEELAHGHIHTGHEH